MEVTRRRGRRRKKLLDDLKDRRRYSHLKEEAVDRTVWRNRFGEGIEPVVRQSTEWMNECFRKVSAHIVALHLGAKLHTHSKEMGKSLRLFKQISAIF